VLGRAATVELACRWSEAELASLERQCAGEESLLADAMRLRGATDVTQFLAIGPVLWEEWTRARRRGAHPGGHLLISTVLDLVCHGIEQPLPEHLLHALYTTSDRPGKRESFRSALAWARETKHAITGLLVPGEKEDTWSAYGALVAEAVRHRGRSELPTRTWRFVSEEVKAGTLTDIDDILAATEADLRPRASGGDAYAVSVLAHMHEAAGSPEAESLYREAADADPKWAWDAGAFLMRHHRLAEGFPYLAAGAGQDPRRYARALGELLRVESEQWLRTAGEAEFAAGEAEFAAGDGLS
jgi:hypothetical protein